MKVSINGKVETSTLEPMVFIDTTEISKRSGPGGGPGVATIDVFNEGLRARYFVSVTMRHGRPILTVTTRRGLGNKESIRRLTGSFNIDTSGVTIESI